jgi:hypothetical protein
MAHGGDLVQTTAEFGAVLVWWRQKVPPFGDRESKFEG